jgi:H+/Cl- antiporter ClcA
VVLGAAIGLFSMLFLRAISALKRLLFIMIPNQLSIGLSTWIIIVCTAGGVVVGLLNRAMVLDRTADVGFDGAVATSQAEGSEAGSAESPRLFFQRVALGISSLGFGGALGPEAPLIEYVSTLGARVGRILKIARDESVQLSVAAALGGLFATPLAASASLDVDGEGAVTPSRAVRLGPGLVAAFTGLLVVRHLAPSGSFHPFEAAPGDTAAGIGTGLVWAGIVAIPAALLIRLTLSALPVARSVVTRRVPGGPVAHGVLGGLVLGIAGAITPLVLFSGHHETQNLLDEAGGRSAASLLGLAALKVLLLVVLLACGYFGGQIFPVGFAGAALALALGQALDVSSTITLVAAGFTAGAAVGVRRPVFTLLLLILFFPTDAWPAMTLATGAAAIVLAWWPAPPPQHH